jgi:hypothetical protein
MHTIAIHRELSRHRYERRPLFVWEIVTNLVGNFGCLDETLTQGLIVERDWVLCWDIGDGCRRSPERIHFQEDNSDFDELLKC